MYNYSAYLPFSPFSECYMKLESVKLEKQVILHGQESKCYSVEPVLRCLPGCVPMRTTAVNVGFHCLPAGESAKHHSRFTKLNYTISKYLISYLNYLKQCLIALLLPFFQILT